jgi:hypothetical protein
MIPLDCECGLAFIVPDSKAGREIECPRCGLEFTAPFTMANRISPAPVEPPMSALDRFRFCIEVVAGLFGLARWAVKFLFKLAIVLLLCYLAWGFYSGLTEGRAKPEKQRQPAPVVPQPIQHM